VPDPSVQPPEGLRQVDIDLAAVRAHHDSYASLWAEAQRDPHKEVFAMLAACRSADDVPALLAAVEALLTQSLRPPDEIDT
jgi:hypothetical protein